MEDAKQGMTSTKTVSKGAIITWLMVNLPVAVFAAWGVNQGTWPSVGQVLSLGVQVAQVAVAGLVAVYSTKRLQALVGSLMFVAFIAYLNEMFDYYHNEVWLTALRVRHVLIVFVCGSVAGAFFGRQRRHPKSSVLAGRSFPLRTVFYYTLAFGLLLSLKAVCPDMASIIDEFGWVPLMPFCWPVSLALGLAAAIGGLAASHSDQIGPSLLYGLLATAALGMLPPIYFASYVWLDVVYWSAQMLVVAAVASLMAWTAVRMKDFRAKTPD